MAGFTESALVKKLLELNPSQQSIQTLSLWLIHHRKHHAQIVKVWHRELIKAKESRKLTFMYLANDVIQNGKKKGPEFGKEFGRVLKNAFEHMSTMSSDDKTKSSLRRLLAIWGERGVYDSKQMEEFQSALGPSSGPPNKKSKMDKRVKKTKKNSINDKAEVTVEIDGMLETHVTLSPRIPGGDPPEPEELIRALQDLENTASGDAVVREKIASLPREVSEISLLSQIEDKESAQRLSQQVNEAVELLGDYNNRLAAEMECRKKVATMLQDFLQSQKELLAQAEQRLEVYTEKLQKVHAVRQEVKSHIQNLPDLTQLPDVTGGLAPLPSAGDLFNLH